MQLITTNAITTGIRHRSPSRQSIKKYEKWTVSYTKDLRIPMMGYTAAINAVFAILIAGTFLFGGVKSGTVNNTFLLNLMFYIIITPIITVYPHLS